MKPIIDSILEPALWFAADWSLRWAVLLTVVALLLWIFRPRRAAIRELVLKAALLAGLLMPFSPRWGDGWERHESVQSSPPSSFPRSAWERTPGRSASRPTHEPDATQSVAPVRSHAERGNEEDAPSGERQPPETSEPLGHRRLIVLGLVSCWIIVVAYQLLRSLCGRLFLWRIRRESVEATGTTADRFAACRAELRAGNSVRLAVHPQVHSPSLLGWLRPWIIVPPDWPQRSIESQRAGLLHELAHVRRGDHLLAPLLEIVRIAFFFHPLVRWLLARLEREREWLCDEMVVRLGIDRRAYARLLLEYARSSGRLAWPAVSLPMSRRRTVKGRIYHLLEEDMERWIRPLPARWAVALAAFLLAVSLGLASYRVWAEEKEKPALPANKPEQQPAPKKPAEPAIKREDLRYANKDFNQWRRDLLTELKPSMRADGMKAFAAFGVNGYAAEATQAIIEVMRGYNPELANTAVEDAPVVNAAFRAIGKIGAASVPALVAAIKEENRNVRLFALKALRNLQRKAQPALPALLQALKNDDPGTRGAAIEAVGAIGEGNKDVVAALIEALNDKEGNIRFDASGSLVMLGESTKRVAPDLLKPAVPALLKALSDKNEGVRSNAIDALRQIGADANAVPAISRLLRDKAEAVRNSAWEYLDNLKPEEAKSAVPDLITALKDPKVELRAINLLGRIGPAAKDAVSALTQELRDDLHPQFREWIIQALKKIDPDNWR